MSATAEVQVLDPAPATLRTALRDGWRRRHAVTYFGRRFNEKRYLRTRLGRTWLLLRPGFTVFWQAFLFVVVVAFESGATPFLITFLVGFCTWSYFSEAAFWATRSLELNRRVLRTIHVPGLVIVAGALTPALVDLAISGAFLLVALLAYLVADGEWHLTLSAATPLVAAGFALLTMLALGIGLALAGPGARYRDVRFTLRFALTGWYFLTPVVYPVTALPDGLRPLIDLNPVTGSVGLIRHGLLDAPAPSGLAVGAAVAGSVAALLAGLVLFVRAEPKALTHL